MLVASAIRPDSHAYNNITLPIYLGKSVGAAASAAVLLFGGGPSRSSYCVAEVEYESWAEELRLCGGDATLIRPSEDLCPARATDLPSPVPLSRLGELPL